MIQHHHGLARMRICIRDVLQIIQERKEYHDQTNGRYLSSVEDDVSEKKEKNDVGSE